MLYIGIDVAKSKHDCFIIDSDGVVYTDNLRITNDRVGFNKLLETILNALDGEPATNAKVGLEHTGHYSINIKRFLESQGFVVTCFNPLETSAFRKASTLRRTKTDKCDAKIIATMLFSDESIPTSLSIISDSGAEVTHKTSFQTHRLSRKVEGFFCQNH